MQAASYIGTSFQNSQINFANMEFKNILRFLLITFVSNLAAIFLLNVRILGYILRQFQSEFPLQFYIQLTMGI